MPEVIHPALLFAAILLAAGAFGVARRAIRQANRGRAMLGLVAGSAVLTLFVAFHLHHLAQVGFTARTNAYGSIFFVLSAAVDLIVVIGLGLAVTALVRLWREVEHWQLYLTLHVQMTADYGCFAAAMAVLTFLTLYVSPFAI